MSLGFERRNALNRTRLFLRGLIDPTKYPKVPKKVRLEALACLRHYPGEYILASEKETVWALFKDGSQFEKENK